MSEGLPMATLKKRARAVLETNDRGRYTIPSGRLYPHQWAWDSAFAAIGWCRVNPERAFDEIQLLLEGQWPDGRVPHIQFHKPSPHYFPSAKDWRAERSSSITNPPVWTLAAGRIHRHLGERVRPWLARLEKSHLFFHQQRDPLNWGVICTAHPWENGQDNHPSWDRPLAAVDPEKAPPFARVDKERVEDASQRPTDDHYRRYMTLVNEIADNDYGLGGFAVYDPFLTTLLVLAERELARLCSDLGVPSEAGERAKKLEKALKERLWSAELGRYRYYDALANEWLEPDNVSAYAPVILGEEPVLKRRLESAFMTDYPLPTVAPDSPNFNPDCYWRGPSWVNVNWLFAPAMGNGLKEKTLKLVERTGFWEYFHPHTGKGLGADDFTWTAALVLDWLDE